MKNVFRLWPLTQFDITVHDAGDKPSVDGLSVPLLFDEFEDGVGH